MPAIAHREAYNVLIPNGTYEATLTNIKPFTNAYCDRVAFEFTLKGEHEGALVLASAKRRLTAKSKLAELLQGILNRPLTNQELKNGLDTDSLIGAECHVQVIVEKNKSGHQYSAVDKVFM